MVRATSSSAASIHPGAERPGGLIARVGAQLRADIDVVLRSFEFARLRWLAVLFLGGGICAGMGLLGTAIGGSPAYLYGEFRVEGLYGGFMTAASSFFLGAAGTSALTAAALLAREDETRDFSVAWTVMAVGLFTLGADDLLMIHEIVGYRLAVAGVPELFGISQDNYMLLAYVFVLVPFVRRLVTSVRIVWRAAFPLAMAVALFGAAEVLDAVVPAITSGALELTLAPIDRMAKALGAIMIFVFAQTFLYEVAIGPARQKRADHLEP